MKTSILFAVIACLSLVSCAGGPDRHSVHGNQGRYSPEDGHTGYLGRRDRGYYSPIYYR
jgi:hypothetical protein